MQSDNINFPFAICADVPADIVESSTIIEEGPRICPLCNSIVRLYFVNFHEKVQMCENTECEFPFGHEDLQFVRHNVEIQDDDTVSEINKCSMSCSMSVVSTTALAEIDKINKACESEDSQFDVKLQSDLNDRDRNLELIRKEREVEMSLKKTVQNIRSMTNELTRDKNDERELIQDEKLISNLMNMQDRFGCQLLKEDEMMRLKKKEPVLGLGELKIDLGDAGDNIPSITIAINSQDNDENNSQ